MLLKILPFLLMLVSVASADDHHEHEGPALGISIPEEAWRSPYVLRDDGSITVFDHDLSGRTGQMIINMRGVPVYENGQTLLVADQEVSPAAVAAYQNLKAAKDFYFERFGLDSFDGQGTQIHASVNVITLLFMIKGPPESAGWINPLKIFWFGIGGQNIADVPYALDLVAHEYTHAVIAASSGLHKVGPNGAINEHLADFFGAAIERQQRVEQGNVDGYNPFLLGDSALRGELRERYAAVRDMLQPERGIPTRIDDQDVPPYRRFADIPESIRSQCRPSPKNDACGVHLMASLLNRAIALSTQHVGWDAMSRILFRLMREELRPTDNLFDYRDLLLAECMNLQAELPEGSCLAMGAAFADVGLGR